VLIETELVEVELAGAESVEAEPIEVEQEIRIAVTPLPQLQVISGPDQGRAFDLGPGELTIGREPGSDIQLGDHSVSHVHALLRVREGLVSIEDLRSTNGTWVNRTKIERQTPLADGDRIDVGREQLLFVQEPGQS
jgi:pSer/pThr/pTyr-binding forkhead associated (FHA) protein